MRKLLLVPVFLLLVNNAYSQTLATADKQYALVIHGGAGNMTKENISEEKEAHYKEVLGKALDAGEKILSSGGAAIDAVQAAIMVMEDDSLFNAGRGAVLTNEGTCEMDASIMNGSDLNAGAVAAATDIKNPILAARYIMDSTVHVMFSGKGASELAKQYGLETVAPDYFITEENKVRLKRVQENAKKEDKHGTVGAVAVDKQGNIAAGTSTGGMTNKKSGRIGDSPIIGAGTYADNTTCGVSCTGWGEYFIRLVMAKSISDRMGMQGLTLDGSVNMMIHDKLERMEATGGVIAIDKYYNVVTAFNTQGMLRAWVKSTGEKKIEIYK